MADSLTIDEINYRLRVIQRLHDNGETSAANVEAQALLGDFLTLVIDSGAGRLAALASIIKERL